MDLLFSIILAAFCVYCFFLVGAESPAPTPTELGAAFWPRIILVLMIFLLILNIVNTLKESKGKEGGIKIDFNVAEFFKSKLFAGIIIVAVMALLMPYIGFMPVCFIFLMAYGALLGEKRLPRLALISLIITIILYIIFQGALDIMLARGIGPFRSFALFFETILPI